MKNGKWITVVVVLQGMILAGQWLGAPSLLQPANAQIPDAGAQRLQIIDELKRMNSKLDKLSDFVESGKLEVKVVNADDKAKR